MLRWSHALGSLRYVTSPVGASRSGMPIAAIALAVLLSGPPLSDPQLERAIEQAQRTPAIADRIEQQPRWRADMVDCQTYVETVLAMANAASLADAKALLDDIRYRSSPISFATRNHFAEAQWLPANEAKGYLQEETTQLDPQSPSATLVLHRERWSKVKGLERLATANIPEGEFSIRYLPLDDARKLAAQFAPGSVLLIVRAADPERVVRVSHMALVVKTDRGLVVRHASFGKEREVIEERVEEFLDRQRTYRKLARARHRARAAARRARPRPTSAPAVDSRSWRRHEEGALDAQFVHSRRRCPGSVRGASCLHQQPGLVAPGQSPIASRHCVERAGGTRGKPSQSGRRARAATHLELRQAAPRSDGLR